MNGEVLNKLVLIKCDMRYLNELLESTDMLIDGCTNTLTELEKRGNDLQGDDLTITLNHLDIYGAYLSEIIFTTISRIEKEIDTIIQNNEVGTHEL